MDEPLIVTGGSDSQPESTRHEDPRACRLSVAAPILAYVFALLGAALVAVRFGAVPLGWSDIASAARFVFSAAESESASVEIFKLRLERTLLCVFLGAGLATTGAVLQRLLRNVLADPFVLGVSAGGTTAVVGAMVLGLPLAFELMGVPIRFLIGFGGCAGALAFMLVLQNLLGFQRDAHAIALAGLVVNAFLGSVLMIIVTLAEPAQTSQAHQWMLGRIQTVSHAELGVVGLGVSLGVWILLRLRRQVDALSFGDAFAQSIGVPVGRVRGCVLMCVATVVAVIVSVAGSIGFVGLIVPHLARRLHLRTPALQWPASAFLGAIVLLFADLCARVVAAPAELPVGIFTACIGAPSLVVLLVLRARAADGV